MNNNSFEYIKPALETEMRAVTHIILKIGTNTLTPHIQNGNRDYFNQLAETIQNIQKTGRKVILVSSGAVGFGRQLMKRTETRFSENSIIDKQALASLGQSLLIDVYRNSFEQVSLPVAQILVSREDFRYRNHYRNLKNTLDRLLSWGAVPVINENDAVAIEELKLGDNDTLSAAIAGMYSNSLLVLMTTVPGFYINNELIHYIGEVNEELMQHAGSPQKGAIGGMKTKLIAARKIIYSGQLMSIISGEKPALINRILNAEKEGTYFFNPRQKSTLAGRKRWILHNKYIEGSLIIDEGACHALVQKPVSLLIVGIKAVENRFHTHAIIDIKCEKTGRVIARGITDYSSDNINDMLNNNPGARGIEIVHRDRLVLLNESSKNN